jgi:hypothetical protein
MHSLIKHLHGFVRDIEPTQAEWASAIDWLTRTGQMCSQKRQEFIMTSDVLGVSMLVDAINHRRPSGHFAITAPGYHGCVTHLFKKGDEFETDVVFGVKERLIVEFVKKPPGKSPTGEMVSMPFYEAKYDFVLQKQAAALAAAE